MSGKKATSSGRVDVRLAERQLWVHYRTEADLRSSLAELAAVYGWDAEEEVIVPGWGRIDLVLRSAPKARPFLVELKLALNKPNEVRRAFQQADGYGRWWSKERGEANTPLVVAKAPNMDIVTPVADAYPAVPFRTISAFIRGLWSWDPTRERVERAATYTQILAEQHARYAHGLANLVELTRSQDEPAAYADHAAWTAAQDDLADLLQRGADGEW